MEDEALSWVVRGEVNRLLSVLDDRQRRVVELRFGLDRGQPRTVVEVAGELGLTPQSVTALQQQAVSRLRRRLGRREAVLELLAS